MKRRPLSDRHPNAVPTSQSFMQRRHFLTIAGGLAPGTWLLRACARPQGSPPLPEPHFPDRLHLFVWRNWEIANVDRLARVAQTTPEKILELGASMGLPAKRRFTGEQLRRIYITVIRQNWHVLPRDQLIELLGWTPEKLEFTLKEDDFLSLISSALSPIVPASFTSNLPPRSAAARLRSAASCSRHSGPSCRSPASRPSLSSSA